MVLSPSFKVTATCVYIEIIVSVCDHDQWFDYVHVK